MAAVSEPGDPRSAKLSGKDTASQATKSGNDTTVSPDSALDAASPPEENTEFVRQNSTLEEERAAATIQTQYRLHTDRRVEKGMQLSKRPQKAWFSAVDGMLGKSPEWQRWQSLTHDAAVVGKGNADANSLMLKKEHWLEATDSKHRYGSNLEPYHEAWVESSTTQPFFHWLDEGDGAALELPAVPRAKLEDQRLQYLSVVQRNEVAVSISTDGKLYFNGSGEAVHTLTDEDEAALEQDPEKWRRHELEVAALSRGGAADVGKEDRKAAKKERNRNKWIFVASSDLEQLYIAPKVKGVFGHSSFLSGGAVGAAGQIAVSRGTILKLSPMSGHYVPTLEHYLAFLNSLAQKGVQLSSALLLNPFEGSSLPSDCPFDLQEARLDALDDKERPIK